MRTCFCYFGTPSNDEESCGFAAAQCGKASPFRQEFLKLLRRGYASTERRRRSLQIIKPDVPVRQSLTALRGGNAASVQPMNGAAISHYALVAGAMLGTNSGLSRFKI